MKFSFQLSVTGKRNRHGSAHDVRRITSDHRKGDARSFYRAKVERAAAHADGDGEIARIFLSRFGSDGFQLWNRRDGSRSQIRIANLSGSDIVRDGINDEFHVSIFRHGRDGRTGREFSKNLQPLSR